MQTLVPPKDYFARETFDREQARIFRRGWQFAGFRRDLANHRDFVTRDVGGTSVVVQNFQGQLRAYQNVCSHRFNRIQTACKGNRALQCGYHGWLYDSEGIPTGIPKKPRFDDLTPEKIQELRLKPWRVEFCGELVFVTEDMSAPNLSDYLGTASATVAHLSSACGRLIDENVMTIRANWKVLVENTLESYHVGFVHPETFSRLQTADGEFAWQPPHSSWATPVGQKLASRMERILKVFAERPVQIAGYLHQLIFPNLTLATTEGMSFSIQLFEPIDPDQTRFTSYVFETTLPEKAVAAGSEVIAALNKSVCDFNRSVFNEDKIVCEQVQVGSRLTSQPGQLSDEELRVYEFQKQYLARMEVADGTR